MSGNALPANMAAIVSHIRRPRLIVTGSSAKVWDAASGQELLTLRGHNGYVDTVAWSPDGKRLATASADQTVQVYAIAGC